MDTRLNIIVVEDNNNLREAFVEALSAMAHQVIGVDCAEALDETLGAFTADVVVLDLNLPGEDGISVAKRLRDVYPEIGIIMVTARTQSSDVSAGYSCGADIYLTKPTTVDELGAALQALSRRVRPRPAAAELLVLKPATRQLTSATSAIDLTAIETMLLAALTQSHDHYLDNWQLIELSGKESDETAKATLEVQITRLRKKLTQVGAATPAIKAVRGAGYQLCVPVEIRKH
jgi:DNA-binding response OmpR family regulator